MNPASTNPTTLLIGDTELPYTLHRSRKRKRTVAFSIEPENGLCVVAPLHTKVAYIEKMLNRRSAWIIKKLADLDKHGTQTKPHQFISGEVFSFLGAQYTLHVTQSADAKMGCAIADNLLAVNIHGTWLSALALQQEVRFEIISWYKKQAKQKLIERTNYWQSITNIHCRRIMLSNPERRWGSCSYENDIRFNWRIIMAPMDVIDYLIVHELCHVVHKNHSDKFWQLVRSILPDYAARRQILKSTGVTYQLY